MLSLVFRTGISEQPDILLPSLRGRGEGVGLFNLHHYESLRIHHLRHLQPPHHHRCRCRRHHTQPRIRGRMQRQPQRHMRSVHRQESIRREADTEGHHLWRQNDKLSRPARYSTWRNGILKFFLLFFRFFALSCKKYMYLCLHKYTNELKSLAQTHKINVMQICKFLN